MYRGHAHKLWTPGFKSAFGAEDEEERPGHLRLQELRAHGKSRGKCGGEYGGLHFLSHAFCLGIAQIYLSEISAFRDKWWKFMETSQAVFGVTSVPGH